jgi:hypothetical protein
MSGTSGPTSESDEEKDTDKKKYEKFSKEQKERVDKEIKSRREELSKPGGARKLIEEYRQKRGNRR